MSMKPIALSLWMAAAATGAMAQGAPPYVGQWAVEGPDACRNGANDDLKANFSTTTIEYYASTCRVVSSRRLSKSGNDAHRLKLACEGGGAKVSRDVTLIVLEKTGERPDLMLQIDAATWATLTYQRCGQ